MLYVKVYINFLVKEFWKRIQKDVLITEKAKKGLQTKSKDNLYRTKTKQRVL